MSNPVFNSSFAYSFHGVAFLLFALVALSASAQSPTAYVLSFPVDAAPNQQIAPGGFGDFVFTVTNTGGNAGLANVDAELDAAPGGHAEYTFVTDDSTRCGLPTLSFPHPFRARAFFSVGPLEVGATFTCRYRVLRASTSTNDINIKLCRPFNFGGWTFRSCDMSYKRGSLPDLALSVEQVAPVPFGASEAMLRLRLTNHSAHAVTGQVASTDCQEFHGGISGRHLFEIETDFPGACTLDEGEWCFSFTGQNFESYGFRFAPLAAHATTSCLVRLRLHRPAGAFVSAELFLYDNNIDLANGGQAFDPQPANDKTVLGVGASGHHAIPMTRSALAVLVVLIGCIGVVLARRAQT